ncbi:MAG: glycosyl hydrolase family 95 catalytic domain-containing protein [Acidobacteriaceae bacterium]
MRDALTRSILAGLLTLTAVAAVPASSDASTAWKNGDFHVNVADVMGRSDIVLLRPNYEAGQAIALGNGRLGIAVWSQNGLTAQLNRADTLPDRLSPGQVVLPDLARLVEAKNYKGRLDLYNGEFREQGGTMTATVYVQPDTDVLVIDVTGANPDRTQTAVLKLWSPRKPRAAAAGPIGMLSQSWVDDQHPGFSGRKFGSLSGITADGREVSATVTNPLTITVSFRPYPDGHFRVLVASPHYDGAQNPLRNVRSALMSASPREHRLWWHRFWNRVGLIKITSTDGAGDYMENLRNIYLFDAAAERGEEYPGTQAGVADMLSSARDGHRWDSSAYWHWNLRMQVAANIAAGLPDLNEPYFNLYRENLSSIEQWTRQNMNGRPGACIPETMRFNGQGIEYESSWKPISVGRDCDARFKPYYNARTLSTGAEISLWVWRQYLATNDLRFLARNYPIMAASARFLLAYQKQGSDGLLHTSPSNAHETQWDVTDPTTDIAAARALYPAMIQAATLLGKDPGLIRKLRSALPKIPPFPRTQAIGAKTLLPPSADTAEQVVIAESYLPAAMNHNAENIGLEPVWPYDLIGDTSSLFALARRTYEYRPFRGVADWSFDPVQAARLDLGGKVGKTLVQITERSQHSINGLANWDEQYGEFYIEQVGVVALALQEMLVQDYDGLIRIAPAVPPGWNVDGSVYVHGRTRVDVQVAGGVVTDAILESAAEQTIGIRNPWPGQAVNIISGRTGTRIVNSNPSAVLRFQAHAEVNYLLERTAFPVDGMRFTPVSGTPARVAKRLGSVQIGIFGDNQ